MMHAAKYRTSTVQYRYPMGAARLHNCFALLMMAFRPHATRTRTVLVLRSLLDIYIKPLLDSTR